MREEKKKKSKKEEYYREEKTNRQHATICQSSRNENDIFKIQKKTEETNYTTLNPHLSI